MDGRDICHLLNPDHHLIMFNVIETYGTGTGLDKSKIVVILVILL